MKRSANKMSTNYDEASESDDIATFTAARPINQGLSDSESDNSPLIHSHRQEKGETINFF